MTRAKNRGFTIVELLVIAPIVILTIGAFVTVIVNMTGDVLASRTTNVLTYSIQDALNRIEQDVKLSTTFLASNNVTLTSPQGFDDGTAIFNNTSVTNGSMLILNTLATTGNPISTTSGLVRFINSPNPCTSSQVNQNKPMTLNIIYFVKNSSLWRRTVMPTAYDTAGCSVPWQQPSCNPSASGAFCKTEDIKLVDGVTTNDFNIQYFNTASNTVADTIANDTTKTVTERNAALESLTTVSATISVNTTAAGRDISQSGSIRTTKLDVNASSIAPIVVPVTPTPPTNVVASFSSPGNINVNWNPTGTSYTLQYADNSGFTSPTTINNITSLSQSVSGLNNAPIYYFRVSATNSAGTSGWSSTTNSWSTIVNGLVAWWRLNGNVTDQSGGGHNGTLIGTPTPTTGQNGQSNSAYSFAAAQGISASLTYPSSSQLTLSAWVRPTSFNASDLSTVIVANATYGNNYAFFMSLTNSATSQAYWYGKSPPGYHGTAAGSVPLSSWTHLVTVWSGTNIKLFTNGVLRTTVAVTGSGTNATTIYIGYDPAQPARRYIGAIDDVRIYNRALTDSEAVSLYGPGAM